MGFFFSLLFLPPRLIFLLFITHSHISTSEEQQAVMPVQVQRGGGIRSSKACFATRENLLCNCPSVCVLCGSSVCLLRHFGNCVPSYVCFDYVFLSLIVNRRLRLYQTSVILPFQWWCYCLHSNCYNSSCVLLVVRYQLCDWPCW